VSTLFVRGLLNRSNKAVIRRLLLIHFVLGDLMNRIFVVACAACLAMSADAFADSAASSGSDAVGATFVNTEQYQGKTYTRVRVMDPAAEILCETYGIKVPSVENFIASGKNVTCGTDRHGLSYFGYLIEQGTLKQLDLEALGYN
jgi:hypothetical protein